MSDFTKDNYRSILDGIIHIVQKAAEVFESAHNWYQKNAEKINEYLTLFADFSCWFTAVQKLAENQIVFTGDLTLELAQSICKSDSLCETVEQYYTENENYEINAVIERCQHAKQLSAYSSLFSQILIAYQYKHYNLACLGMLAVVDGTLSDVSENQKTGYKVRLQEIEKKISDKFELTDLEKKLMCIYVAMDHFEESIFKNSDFSQDEPDDLNRHWMIHGRTRREYTNLDFIKIILWLDAIIFLDDKLADHKEVKEL